MARFRVARPKPADRHTRGGREMSVDSTGRRGGVLLLTLGLCLLSAGMAHAQFRAAIQGTVTDPTGGAMPGATIVVLNNETGQSHDTISNESGFYRVSGLAPGRYKVTASISGFKETIVDNVSVGAEETRGLDLLLEPGGLQETVTVTSTPKALQTENADVAGTLSTVEVQRLPQVGRDPFELVRLTPGMFGLGARDATGGSVRLPKQEGARGSRPWAFS